MARKDQLYFISRYAAFKERLGVCVPGKPTADSEFLQLVPRGKLSPPPQELFDLLLYYYSFFKARSKKRCSKVFLEAYKLISESTDYELQNVHHINRRFSNSFFKAFVKKGSDQLSK